MAATEATAARHKRQRHNGTAVFTACKVTIFIRHPGIVYPLAPKLSNGVRRQARQDSTAQVVREEVSLGAGVIRLEPAAEITKDAIRHTYGK